MKWEVNDTDYKTVRDFIRYSIGLSRNTLRSVKFNGGELKVNGKRVDVRHPLKNGDRVEITFPTETRGPLLFPEGGELDIVYEDDFLLVVNKPAGIATIPSPIHKSGTIANRLIYYYDKIGLSSTIHIVTRLDRDTSGLMLVAKYAFFHGLLHNSEIDRGYKALVNGELPQEEGVIDAPIGRKSDSIIEREVSDEGKKAITHFKRRHQTNDYTWVDLKLDTGRTHQIRVHLAHIGYPLIGDDLYGGDCQLLKRHALHCDYLRFFHPITKEYVQLKSQIPDDLAPFQ
ncbi:ribosomal large subunit pseudouridine synthase D [Pelagirhabdus alkalitolerans]|uniref:Pseudouridine synthase n=1 Tax=Pelagirhabdus alkalitolerans TaxID=1612202 RepID=A0A1G6KEB0_9BACI|nr:RluA family pseudouridine synthase [Pelagirhabdus alkalitolerans]SDC29188.1 ribosomal large subunit pseudouridine synthase D [Pelagirhabdus alkalitolerans]